MYSNYKIKYITFASLYIRFRKLKIVRNYKRKQSYSSNDLQLAIRKVKAGGITSYRARKTDNILYSTVYRQLKSLERAKQKTTKSRQTALSWNHGLELAENMTTLEK